MPKAHFRTGYLQREIPLEVAVKGDLAVKDLVTLTAANGSVPAYIAAAASLATATHIVAQSDMTMNSHVKVEDRNYGYDPEVAQTIASSGTVAAATPTKLVALYAILDESDIIVEA